MSKLDELIKELCPDRIKYIPLLEIATYRRGSFPQPYTNQSYYGGEGSMPFVQVADVDEKSFKLNDKTKNRISKQAMSKSVFVPAGTVIVTLQGSIGKVAITQYDAYVDRTLAIFEHYQIEIDKKYFAYQLYNKFEIEKQYARGTTLKTITKEEFSKFEIPVPPLDVQKVVVNMLDYLNNKTNELKETLQNEFTARRQQYEYYRDYLLNFEEDSLADDIESVDMSAGVKQYRLDDICNVYDGTHQTPDYKSSGVKFVSVENIKDLYGTTKYISESDFEKYKIKPQKDDVLMTRIGDIGTPAIVTSDEPLAYYVSLALLRPNTDVILTEYLYHFISTRYFRKELNKRIIHTAVPIKINKNEIGKCMITVPSIATQKKLVDILNRFDNLSNDMSEGLPAEIDARQKQYEYYRDVLLSFDEERRSQLIKVERERELRRSKALKWLKLGEIATITRGTRVVRKQLQEIGNYPVYQNSLTPLGYYDNNNRSANTAYVIAAGAAGEIGFSYVDFWAADDCYTFDCPDNLNSRYLYYVLMSNQSKILSQVRKSSIPRLPRTALEQLVIPVPSLEEQERIVSILDRFDKLCNDISEGIPAEIEARQKQYEYYRDKLLTFKEKVNE